jgi:hypothetical protein
VAVAFDFAEVGFAFVGVGGDGEQGMLAVAVSGTRVTVWAPGCVFRAWFSRCVSGANIAGSPAAAISESADGHGSFPALA